MTPKEKATELVNKFYKGLLKQYVDLPLPTGVESLVMDDAKISSIICVDEVLQGKKVGYDKQYWLAVKTEIKKL